MAENSTAIDPTCTWRLLSKTIASSSSLKPYTRTNPAFSPLSIHALAGILAVASAVSKESDTSTSIRAHLLSSWESLGIGHIPDPSLPSFLGPGVDSPVSSAIAAVSKVDFDDEEEEEEEDDGPSVGFSSCNWGNRYFHKKPQFCWETGRYRSLCDIVDFKSEAADVREKVNAWFQSFDGPDDLLSVGSVRVDTELIVCNALTFIGVWAEKFEVDEYSDFYLLDGSSISVPFMTSNERQCIVSYPGFKVLRLPYKHGKEQKRFAMYIFLPEAQDGIWELEERMGNEPSFLESHMPDSNKLVPVEEFKLPINSGTLAVKTLGVVWPPPRAHEEYSVADKESSMYGPLEFYCCSSLQFPFFKDEGSNRQTSADDACRSSAAAPLGRLHTCRPFTEDEHAADFVADHPFVYVIREDESGIVLVTGHVCNPGCVCNHGD